MTIDFLDWNPMQDSLLRPAEMALHEVLHKERVATLPEAEIILANPRLHFIPIAEKISHTTIMGQVLDIGCGNGYASAWLALNRPVEKIYAMEITEAAVRHLIPAVIEKVNVTPGLIQPVHGSFNSIPLRDHFDFIVAFGALHHSSDLLAALVSCRRALKPGGILIAHEPTTHDHVSNSTFREKYLRKETFAKTDIHNGDRDDHFYRECEYKTAIHFADFELLAFMSATQNSRSNRNAKVWLRNLGQKLHRLLARGFRSTPQSKNSIKTQPHLIVARRPIIDQSVPHKWMNLA